VYRLTKKALFSICFILSLIVTSSQAWSAIVSLESNYVEGEADIVGHLNRDRQAMVDGINNISGASTGTNQSSGQIQADTIAEENMADDANPRIRTYEGAACEFVYTGLLPSTTSGTLIGSIPSGTAYPAGYRIKKASSTAHTFTASKWTWIDLDKNGNFNYLEQAIGSSAPSVTADAIRLARVSTDSAQISTVTDLRTTTCTDGPFSGIRDAQGEASLGDIFTNGAGGWENGLAITSNSTTKVNIGVGSAYINGQYRTLSSVLSIDSSIIADPASSRSGIDSGTLIANKNYYIYAVGDQDATNQITGILSTSSTAPSGTTNSRRIGEVSTDTTGLFNASFDTTSVSYQGAVRQRKRYQSGAVWTTSATIPNDDTPPQITEGSSWARLFITPTSSANRIRINANIYASNTTGSISETIAVFKDSQPDAVCTGFTVYTATTQYPVPITIRCDVPALSTSEQAYQLRIGGASATTTVNGINGSRVDGGYLISSFDLEEYES